MVLLYVAVFPKENLMFLSRAPQEPRAPERLSREGVPRVSREPLERHTQAAVAIKSRGRPRGSPARGPESVPRAPRDPLRPSAGGRGDP